MSINTKITIFENSNGKLCKHIKADGSKTSHALLYNGSYETIELSSLKELNDMLRGLLPSQAIGLGIPSDKSTGGSIVTQHNMSEGSITRSKKHFEWNAKTQILLFDYDFFEEMYEEMKITIPDQYRELLIKLDDKFSNAEMLIVPSSSSGIYNNSNNETVLDANGMHCYVAVNDIEKIDTWIDNLFTRAWELKLACIKLSKDGKQLSRSIFDKAVFSPERLIFEASPTLDDGLIQTKVDPFYIDGNVIDLSDVVAINKNSNESKAYKTTLEESKKIKNKYIKDRTKELVSQGVHEDEAYKFIRSRCENGQIDRYDTVVLRNGTSVLAKDLTLQHDRVYCIDPIEPDLAPAIINVNEDDSIMIYSFLHGGRKFYVKEEKFKHKTLPIITKPVNPDIFCEKFSKKWLGYKNVVTPPLKETWMLNCIAMNNAIVSDSNIKYIVPAVTGSGKTEGIITYCTLLPEQITVIISTNLTAEADRIAESINTEANKTIAVASHSKSKLSIDEVSDYQIVVVSHEFYRRHHEGDKKWDQLGDRDLIILDEALYTMKEVSVSAKEIQTVINLLTEISTWKRYIKNQELKRELILLVTEYNFLVQIQEHLGKGTKLINSEQMSGLKLSMLGLNIPKNTHIKDLFKDKYRTVKSILINDKNIRYNKVLTSLNSITHDQQIRKIMLETLTKLETFVGSQLYVTANQGQYSYHKVIDSTPKHSLVCFDATADINKFYDYRAEYHNDLIKVKRVESTRDYSTVNLYAAITKTGKSAINTTYIVDVMSNIRLGEKTLIITHKANESLFMNYINSLFPEKHIEVSHWGALTGLNNWQDFDTCIISGLNHKPSSYIQNRTIVSTNENTAFGDKQDYIRNTISTTDIVSEIIQAINRIRVRRIVNIKGECLSANIYLTLPSSIDNKQYKDLILSEMPNINILDWKLPKSICNDVITKGFLPAIISYLKSNLTSSDEISINEPRDVLNIKNESYRTIIKKVSFEEKLKDAGFEIVSKTELDKQGRARKRPTKYLRRIR